MNSALMALANLPLAFRSDRRSSPYTGPETRGIAAFVSAWVAGFPGNLSHPGGASLLGPPLSGKTYWGCVALEAALVHHRCVRDNFCDFRRIDYLELMAETNNYEAPPLLLNNLREGTWIFLDNITLRAPNPVVLSALLARRDWGRPTWLAFQAPSVSDLAPGLPILWQSFEGVNRGFLLRPFSGDSTR